MADFVWDYFRKGLSEKSYSSFKTIMFYNKALMIKYILQNNLQWATNKFFKIKLFYFKKKSIF